VPGLFHPSHSTTFVEEHFVCIQDSLVIPAECCTVGRKLSVKEEQRTENNKKRLLEHENCETTKTWTKSSGWQPAIVQRTFSASCTISDWNEMRRKRKKGRRERGEEGGGGGVRNEISNQNDENQHVRGGIPYLATEFEQHGFEVCLHRKRFVQKETRHVTTK
jgi:hypothetical protein